MNIVRPFRIYIDIISAIYMQIFISANKSIVFTSLSSRLRAPSLVVMLCLASAQPSTRYGK